MAKILTSSDCSLCVEFGNAISEEINKQVRSFTVAAETAQIKGVTELVRGHGACPHLSLRHGPLPAGGHRLRPAV